MEQIVKVLLQEGIDEETIHEVLDVIEENYEIVDETVTVGDAAKAAKKVQGSRLDAASASIGKGAGSFKKNYTRSQFADALAQYPETSKMPLKTLLQAAKNSVKPREEDYVATKAGAHFQKNNYDLDKRYSKQNKPHKRARRRLSKAEGLSKEV